jgi:hypothetical protein
MTVEADVFTTIKGLCGNRAYPDLAPLNTAKPYVTYTQIGGEPVSYVENVVPDIQNGRFQFNVWGTSRSQCSALMLQIENALVTSALFQARPVSAQSGSYDFDMSIYGAQMDFTIWSTR